MSTTSDLARTARAVSLLYLIKQVELAARQALEEVADQAGLTALQYTALTVLERQPGITSAQLARNSFVRTQTMAEMVGHLRERGLLERARDKTNRRQYLLTLTEVGRTTVSSLSAPAAEIEQRMLTDLDGDQTEALRSHLLSCRRALTEDPLR